MGRRPRSGHGRRARLQGNRQSGGPTTPRAQPRLEDTMNVQDSTTSAQPFIRRNSTETSLVNALSRLHLSEGGHQNSLRQSTSGGQAHQKTPQNAESDSPKTQAFSTLSKEKSGEEGKNHKEDGAEALVSNPTHPLRRDGGDRTEQLKLPEQEREPSRSLSRVEQIPRCSPFAWCTSAGQDARRTVDQGISSLFQAESGLLSVGARPHVSRPPPLFQFSLVPHPEVLGEFSVAAGDDVHHHLLRAGLGSPSCPNPSTPLQHSRADNEFSRYLQLLSAENPHTAGNRLGVRDNSSLAVQQFSAAAPSSPLLARRGLRCSPRNTLLIFDWDDTLFPSSWLRCAGIDPLNPLQFGTFSELPSHVQEALTVCEDRVLQVLEAAHELGMVMVVSNAHTRWLRLSLEKLMPRVGVLMRQREVAVVSARCVCEAVGCPDASLWKTATFDALIDAFMRTHAAEVARHRQLDQNSTLLPRGRTVRNMIEGGYPQSANTVGALRIPRYLTNSGTRTAAAMMALEDRDAGGGAEETARLSAGTSTTDQRADSGCHVSTLAQLGFGGQAVQSRTVSDASRNRRCRPMERSNRPQSGVRFATTLSYAPQRSSDSCCSGCSEESDDNKESSDGRWYMGACRSSEEEDNIDQESHSRQQSNFYNILAFGDQAHDRFAFFTAAHNAIRRRQTEACRQPQQPQQPPEHLPRFLELEDISTLACGTVHPAQASRPTCSNAAVTTVPVRRDQEVSRRLQGTSPLLQASDVLASRFEVVVDFDSAQLQQQVRQLQALQQQQFPLPLRQQLQSILPFAHQTAAVSERLLWHFRCPTSPLLPHAPETLLLRRLSRTSSDTQSEPAEIEQNSDDRAVDANKGERQCASSAATGDATTGNDKQPTPGRPRSGFSRGRRRRLRRPGAQTHLGDGHFRSRHPADLRHRVKPVAAMNRSQSQKEVAEQGQQTDEREGHCANVGTLDPEKKKASETVERSKAVYLKSVRLMAGPSAAELSEQLGLLLKSLRRLAESPSFHDLQVNDSRPDQGSVRVPSALPTQAQSTTAASVATASAMATAAAVTAARAAATAAAARGAAPAADLSSPVEAVLAASAMAARAAATVAASAADVFAVTTATRGVEAGVEADLIPLPPEAEEQNRHRTRSELLTRRTHLAEHFAEWRRVVTEGREATKTASEAGGDMETDSVNCFQTRAAQVHQVAQPRRSSEEDARRTTAMGHFTLRTTTEELDAFGYMEEKLLRKRNSRRGSSRK